MLPAIEKCITHQQRFDCILKTSLQSLIFPSPSKRERKNILWLLLEKAFRLENWICLIPVYTLSYSTALVDIHIYIDSYIYIYTQHKGKYIYHMYIYIYFCWKGRISGHFRFLDGKPFPLRNIRPFAPQGKYRGTNHQPLRIASLETRKDSALTIRREWSLSKAFRHAKWGCDLASYYVPQLTHATSNLQMSRHSENRCKNDTAQDD